MDLNQQLVSKNHTTVEKAVGKKSDGTHFQLGLSHQGEDQVSCY